MERARAQNSTFVYNTVVTGKELIIGAIVGPDGIDPHTDANVDFFQGAIDDVCIYDRGLNAEEITTLYRDGLPILGQVIAGNRGAYTHLPESIRMVPLPF